MTDQTRKAFEAWFKGDAAHLKLGRNGDGYTLQTAQISWFTWQAATLAERERCALVCEALHYSENSTAQNCADAIRQGGAA